MSYKISLPRIMQIGSGAIDELPHILSALGCRTPLIVTDIIMQGAGYCNSITRQLDNHRISYEVFTGVAADADLKSIDAGSKKAAAGTCCFFPAPFDCIIALGGDSSIDVAKSISINLGGVVNHQRHSEYHSTAIQNLPVIAIPTSCSGTETSQYALIQDPDTIQGLVPANTGISPAAVIMDYDLIRTAPSKTIAENSLAAIARAIESYVSQKATLYSDQLALGALSLISNNIRQAVFQPKNKHARQQIMLGTSLAGKAYSVTSGALLQSISQVLSTTFELPHNSACAMLLPIVTEYSLTSATTRYAACARAMEIAMQTDNDAIASIKLVDELKALRQELKTPGLSGYGIKVPQFIARQNSIVEQVTNSACTVNNPRIPSRNEIMGLYEEVWNY